MRNTALLLSFAGILLAGCGGDDGPTGGTNITTTVPPAPVTSVIDEGSFQLETNTFLLVSDVAPSRGDLESIVDWTFNESVLFMYLTAGDCNVQQFALDVCPNDPACACTFLDRSEATGPKPRRLNASNHEGPYGLIVWNVGNRNESISWQTLLTTTSTLRSFSLQSAEPTGAISATKARSR